MECVSTILIACTQPHNFIIHEEVLCDINYDTGTEEIDSPHEKEHFDMSDLPVVPIDEVEVFQACHIHKKSLLNIVASMAI